MKKFLVAIFLLASCIICCAQNIYKGKSQYVSDVIANVQENILYERTYKYQSYALYNYDGKYVRKRLSKYDSDIIVSYSNGKIYKGKDNYVIGHFSDGVFYSGNTRFYPLFNYDGKYVRRKNSKYDSDIVLTTQSYVNPVFLYLILFEL